MKKLVFMFVAMAAISFASCGNAQKPAEVVEDTTNVELTDSLQGDSLQNDSLQNDSL